MPAPPGLARIPQSRRKDIAKKVMADPATRIGGEGRGGWGPEHPAGPQDPGWGLAPLRKPAGTKKRN